MIQSTCKRFLSFMLALVMVLAALPLQALAVEMLNTTVLDGKVKVYTDGVKNQGTAVKNDDGSITVTTTATASCKIVKYEYTANSHTVWVENNTADETLSLEFVYSASGLGTLTVNGNNSAVSGKIPATLAPGEKITIVITSPATGVENKGDTASITLSNFTLQDANAKTVVVKPGTNGTVSVNGSTITEDKTVNANYTTGFSVSATAASGYEFVAWVDSSNNVYASTASATIHPSSDTTINAVFVPKNSAANWLADGKLYTDLTAACTAAQSGDKFVVLLSNGILPKNDTGYTIPAEITVLIPYDDLFSISGTDPVTVEIPSATYNPTAYLFRKLTMESGANLTVYGTLELGAKHYASHGGKQIGGTPYSGYGQIDMLGNSTITVNEGGKLFTWGYITGSDTATVTVNPGAQVYEKFQVTDYHGGSLTGGMLGAGIFAFNQYYIQNIEVREIVHAGASLICHAGIYGEGVNEMAINFMAADGMFKLDSGYVSKCYDASTDRMIMDVNGNISLDPITMDFSGKDYNTSEFELPLNDNITININNGASVTVNQDILMMPGTQINVQEGGTLNLASGKKVYLVNKDNWDKFCFGAELQPLRFVGSKAGAPVARSLSVAKLDINGKLELNGQLYNSEAGALVTSSKETGVVEFKVAAPTGNATISQSLGIGGTNLSDKFDIKAKGITMVPAILTNGEVVDGVNTTVNTNGIAAGTKYEYCETCDKWVVNVATVTFDANGGSGEMDAVKVHADCTATLPANAFTAPEGKKFAGWNTADDGSGTAYAADTVLSTFTADTTIYAQWEADAINVVAMGNIAYTVNGQVVTVTHSIACKVGYWSETDQKYIAITAAANDDGSYSFTAPEGVTEVLLVVKGDANTDGKIAMADATRVRAAYNSKVELTVEQKFAADQDNNGAVNMADATSIRAVYNSKKTLIW